MERGLLAAIGNQAIGGRKGGAALAVSTIAVTCARSRPAFGIVPAPAKGTSKATLHDDRQWQPPWQQSPCPPGTAGAGWRRDNVTCARGMPVQCTGRSTAFIRACAAPMGTGVRGAPNASAVHASKAIASTMRKIVERGRGR